MTTTTEAPEQTTTIPAPVLLRAMRNACLFASTDTTLPVLNAVRIQADGARLTVDATDRYKLLQQTVDVDGLYIPPSMLTLPDAKRLCRELDGAVKAIPLRARGSDAVHTIVSADDRALRAQLWVRAQLWRSTTVYSYDLPDLGEFPAIERILEPSLDPSPEAFVLDTEHLAAFAACRIGDKRLRWQITGHGNGKPTHWTCVDEASRHQLRGVLMAVIAP